MVASHPLPSRFAARRALVPWLGFALLMLSLLAPVLSIEAAAAAQGLTAQQAPCDDGFVRDERTGECVPEPQRVPAQIATECPEGTVREQGTGACIPESGTEIPEATEVVEPEAPETEPADAIATAPPDPVGYVQAIARACPEGFAPDAATTVTDLQNACLDPIAGVPFQVLVGGVAHVSVPTDETGLAQLGAAPVGEIALAEEIPAGYGEPLVYCAEGYAFGPFEHTYTEADRQPLVDGNAVAWTLAADTLLQCFFYGIPAGAPAGPGDITAQTAIEAGDGIEVTVVKHRCPLGVPEDTTLDQYLVFCAQLFPGVGFTLEHDGGSLPGETGEDGTVSWGDVPAGEVAIHEEIPVGYKDPLAFCATFAGEQELASGQVAATGGVVPLTLPGEATSAVCWLFNLQDETAGSITIQKWVCPPGYEIDPMVEDPLDSCTEPGGGVTFTLDDGNPPAPDQTQVTGDDQGAVLFAGLAPGTYTVTEEVPEGIAQATGWCASIGQVQALDNPPRLVIDLAEGEHWVCDWLNIPDDGEPDLNGITITKHRCPLGIPAEDFDQDSFAASCTDPHEGVTFTLETGAGADPRATDESGAVSWEDIPAGPFSLQETIPAGYLDPYVYCTYTPEGLNALGMEWTEAPLAGGVLELEMGEGADRLECDWYNVPDEDAHSLVMHKWECPAEFDENANDPDVHCTTPLDGVTFTLGDLEAVSGDAGPGTALFFGIPNGDYALTEVLPDGYARAFHGGCLLNGGAVLQIVDDGENVPVIPFTFEAGEAEHWECDWFNVPLPPEENDVTIRKWICPPGTGHGESQGTYESTCLQQHEGVTFGITSGAHADSGATVGGAVVFEGVPAGTATITETIPPGFGEPVIFCAVANQWAQYDASTPIGAWQHDFVADGQSEELFCYVFNIPSENRTVIAHKFTCPAGLEPESEDIADWQDTCDQPAADIAFTLTDADGESTDATAAAGFVAFHDVAQGEVTLTEHTPPGYAPAIVYCSLLAFDANGGVHHETTGPEQTDGTISREIDAPGFLWSCWFFNIPLDPEENGVEIRKWQCPEGTGLEESLDWYEANCVQQHDGVAFTVTSDLGIAVQETAAGVVQFDGLPAGTVGIQEAIPEGFGPPVVFCAPDDSLWLPYDAPTGHWDYDFIADGVSETLVCLVFNIPGEPPSVTIHKWTCPPGYDLFAAGADPKADCTNATNGVGFQLGPDDGLEGEAALQTTGDVIDGGVVFDGLEPGVYKAVEVVPDGIASVFVLECTGHLMGVLQPYPLQLGNVLDGIDVDAGEHLVCDWFNVPAVEGGSLTLIKYVCATETFVDEVDCEVYEHGATFDLRYWTGTWDLVGTETTDGVGRIQWTDLPDGEYWFEEHDGPWCHIASDLLYEDGPWVIVLDDAETVVHVYNCDPGWVPDDTPDTYPNTGVPPVASTARSATVLPGLAQLAASFLLLGAWRGRPLARARDVLGRRRERERA